jgi:2-methylfumaryl-CoA isomerase
MQGILNGMRIVEGSAFIAAPLSGMMLAQLGADVIRFDPIEGGLDYTRWPITADGKSLYWAGMNKGKRSIAIDLRNPAGRELATALITAPGENAGMFVTNFPATGWLDYERLAAKRADLIMLTVTGNHDGSSAVDYTVNCATGLPFVTGDARPDRPVNHVLPAWDIATGMLAATGLLAAERHRSQSGRGQLVKLALSDVAFAMLGAVGHLAELQVNHEPRRPMGNHLFGAFGRNFATKDGRQIMIVALTPRQWSALVEATGLSDKFALVAKLYDVDLAMEGNRFLARDGIAAALMPWCAAHTLAEIRAIFDAKDVCWGPYQDFEQMLAEDPRCSEANPMFATVEQSGIGPYLMPATPLDFSALPRLPARPAPRLGQQTDEVLSEILGLPSHAIADLHDRRIVG